MPVIPLDTETNPRLPSGVRSRRRLEFKLWLVLGVRICPDKLRLELRTFWQAS
jgi:hypothetical protein